MNTLKEIMYKSALTFTLLVMSIMPFSASKPQLAMTSRNVLILFFMACCIGISFLVFKIKKLPPAARRIIHICLCYGISLAFLLPLTSERSQTLLMFFFITLALAVVYPLLMLLSYLSGKIGEKLNFKE